MTTSIISAADTCAQTAGSGMVTTWQLAGMTSTYDGDLVDADGYQVVATLTWQSLTTLTEDLQGTSITANAASVMGTCVETLDDDGVPLRSWDVDGGNIAICHWFYFLGRSNTSGIFKNGTA